LRERVAIRELGVRAKELQASAAWAATSFSKNSRGTAARARAPEGRSPVGRPSSSGHPRKYAARNDHVNVRMMGERRPPSVQNEVTPIRAPRCLGSAAIVITVSAEA